LSTPALTTVVNGPSSGGVGRRSVLAATVGALVAAAGCAGGDGDGDDGDGDGDDGDGPTATPTSTPGSDPTATEAADDPTTTATGGGSGGDGYGDGYGDPGGGYGGSATATPTGTVTDGGAGDLDLREANVTGVEFERSGDGYRFSVTLIHDDDGEDGYANWWQVETTDGDVLGRRELLHAHGTRAFTRSETVAIPEGVRVVVVRGHDRTHGYGGQAAVVDLDAGTVELVRQGPERRSFADRG
jgi:hypothetical protein